MSGSFEFTSVQLNIEKTAKLSEAIFHSPRRRITFPLILCASLAGLLLEPGPGGMVRGLLLIALPGLAAAVLSAPVIRALGGTFYQKRSTFLALLGCAGVGLVLGVSLVVRMAVPFPDSYGIILGYSALLAVRHTALYATANNKHARTLPGSVLQTLVAVPPMLFYYPPDARMLLLGVCLPLVFLLPTIFFLSIFDTPIRKNFKVSAFDFLRYFLDHFTTGSRAGEELIARIGEGVEAKVGVVAFRRRSGALKACLVVPALHPGPVGLLGGGDLPQKIAERVHAAEHVLVPHGAATHDFNPTRTEEVSRVGDAVDSCLPKLACLPGGSPMAGAESGVRVTAQLFGNGVLLAYTSWPEPIDDVEYGVGLAAELAAKTAGAQDAVFVDCHNSLMPGAGGVFICTPRADRIQQLAHDAAADALKRRVSEVRIGTARAAAGFPKGSGIGKQGVQVLAVEAGGQRAAYVLWDANNMVPLVTQRIREALKGVVDAVQVMTTDNHSVNLVPGGFNPLGHTADPAKLGEMSRDAVLRALQDLEPVECAVTTLTVPGIQVWGHHKTARLTASVNTLADMAPKLFLAALVMQLLGTALLFYIAGVV